MDRPAIHGVAAAAVGPARVDRVPGRRGAVAGKSAREVEEAVQEPGHVRDLRAANLSRARRDRLCFLLPNARTGFPTAIPTALVAELAQMPPERVVLGECSAATVDVAAQGSALRALDPAGPDALAVIGTDAPDLRAEIARLRAGDDAAGVEAVARAALEVGDVSAIYHCGAGNRGLARALADMPAGAAGRPAAIVRDLTDCVRQALPDDVIELSIDQDPVAQAARAIALMRAMIEGPVPDPGEAILRPHLN